MERARSWIRRLVVIIVAVEVVWLVAANLLLNTGLLPWLINQKPEKLSVQWERGYSWYPARVHAEGFVLQQHGWTTDIELRVPEVEATFRLLPLLGLRIVLDDVDAHDLRVSLVHEVPEGEKPEQKRKKPGIRIAIEDIAVHSVDQVSFNEVVVAGGEPSATGNFAIQVHGDIELYDMDVDWTNAQITIEGETIADSISLGFEGGLLPFDPKVVKGPAVLDQISGDLVVVGHTSRLQPIQLLLRGVDWVEKIDGAGQVDVDVSIDDGKLLPGSKVDVVASGLELWFLGFAAEGSGNVNVDVRDEDAGREGELVLLFEDFGLRRQGEEKQLARGSGLELRASAGDLGLKEGIDGISIDLQIPDSEIPDVSVLGEMLSPGLDLEIDGGRATLSGQLQARGDEEEAEGVFAIRGTDLAGSFRGLEFGIDLAFDTQVSGQDLDDFEVELVGTEMRLFDGEFRGNSTKVEKGWWMTIGIPKGRANLLEPIRVDADLDLAMRDTRALLALFAEVKSWIGLFDGFLTVRDVEGDAELQVTGPRVSVRDLDLNGDRLEAMAELELEGEENAGIFWGKLGIVSFGMERIGDETDFKLVNGRKWYEERRETTWTGSSRP